MSATTAPWPFHCASCAGRGTGSALSFHDWDGLMRHMETEHRGDQHPHRCSSCTYVFGKMDDLQRHLSLGTVSFAERLEPPASRMLPSKIEEQRMLFPTLKRASEPVAPTAKRARSRMKISDLVNSNPAPKRSKFASYQGNPRFACKVCGISYQYNSNLQRHIRMTHEACDLCNNENLKSQDYLEHGHTARHHRRKHPYSVRSFDESGGMATVQKRGKACAGNGLMFTSVSRKD